MNTTITSTANSIKFEFNDDKTLMDNFNKICFNKTDIEFVKLNDVHIDIVVGDAHRLICSDVTNTSQYLKVDTVAGVAPTSLSDLYDKIIALIA